MKKYGVSHFRAEIIEECIYDILDKRERFWIEELNTIAPNGYNLLPGGKQLFGEDNPFYGKTHTDETRKIISQKNTGRKATEEEIKMRKKINSGENNPFYGKHHSKETIQTIVEKNRANGNFEKASIRMKENNPNNPEMVIKPVIMFDKETGEIRVFESAMSAGEYVRELGLTNAKYPGNSIGDVCRGKQKSAFGRIWNFVKPPLRMNFREKTAGYIVR